MNEEEAQTEIVVWGDNESRIKTIQGWFGAGSAPLLKPGRILVGEGILLKQCRKKLKPRQFFLFNDILMYANIIVARKRYNKQRILNLSELSVEPAADERAIQVLAPGRSFLVLTATAEEAKEWIFHIKMCVSNLPEKPVSKPPSAAVWIPDKAAELCMICNFTRFTTFNRRHHCRKCGKVACSSCSSKKWDLPAISSKPSRVCDNCYEKLSKSSDGSQNPSSTSAVRSSGEGREEGRDFESDDELQNSGPSLADKAVDSDSEEDGEGGKTSLGDLTVDMKNVHNVRASLFFTNEDNQRISLNEVEN